MTLWQALTATMPRIIRFTSDQVWETAAAFYVQSPANSYLLVDGNGHNVIIKGAPIVFDGVSDVQFRNIRFTDNSGLQFRQGSHNIRVVNCTFTDTADPQKPLSFNRGAYDAEVAWNIFANHTYGLLSYNAKNISVHHNLFYNNLERNPKFGDSSDDPLQISGNRCYQFINNLVVDWINSATEVAGMAQVDAIKNVSIPGPNLVNPQRGDFILLQATAERRLYVEGNYGHMNVDGLLDNWLAVTDLSGQPGFETHQSLTRLCNVDVPETSAYQALSDVLAKSGVFPRTSDDQALINSTKTLYQNWRKTRVHQ